MKCHAMAMLACLAGIVATAEAADFVIRPSIAVSEEFNDNIFNTPNGRRSDFISRAMPGVTMKYQAPFWDWDSSYNLDYRHYARRTRGDEITHNLQAKGLVKMIDEFMFLDMNDTYTRVSLDVARDVTNESLFVNQSDRNTLKVSPFFLWRLGQQATLKTGYRYVNVWYREPSAVDKADSSAFADLGYEITQRLNLTAGYTFTIEDAAVNDFTKHDASAGMRYEYAERSFVHAQAGNTWIDFARGGDLSNLFWNAGVDHSFNDVTIRLNTGVTYTEDPLRNLTKETSHSGRVEKRLERGNLNVFASFSEFKPAETGLQRTRRLGIGGGGRYEFTERVTGNFAVTGERFSRTSPDSFPYKIYGSLGLSYLLAKDFTVGVSYTHVTNFKYFDFDSPDLGSQVNRAMVELRKVF